MFNQYIRYTLLYRTYEKYRRRPKLDTRVTYILVKVFPTLFYLPRYSELREKCKVFAEKKDEELQKMRTRYMLYEFRKWVGSRVRGFYLNNRVFL